MHHDHRRELEAQIDGLVDDTVGTRRRWTVDTFAQGALLDLLDGLGFEHGFLPPLMVEPDGSAPAGSGFRSRASNRAFVAYDADERVALAMAAAMALRAAPRLVSVVA